MQYAILASALHGDVQWTRMLIPPRWLSCTLRAHTSLIRHPRPIPKVLTLHYEKAQAGYLQHTAVISYLQNKNTSSGSLLPYTNLTNLVAMLKGWKLFQDTLNGLNILETKMKEQPATIQLSENMSVLKGTTKALLCTEEMKIQPTGSPRGAGLLHNPNLGENQSTFNQTFIGLGVMYFYKPFPALSSFSLFSLALSVYTLAPPVVCVSGWYLQSPRSRCENVLGFCYAFKSFFFFLCFFLLLIFLYL